MAPEIWIRSGVETSGAGGIDTGSADLGLMDGWHLDREPLRSEPSNEQVEVLVGW